MSARLPLACRAVVRAASLLVPLEARADWRREWDAELCHVHARGGRLTRMALGAFADALEMGIAPRAFADAARFGHAALARSPLHVAGAAAVLATGISAAGVCLALAWAASDGGGPSALLLAVAVPLVVALVCSASAVAARLIRHAIARHPSTLPCSADEARAAASVLCAAAGAAALVLAAAATIRFPDASAGWSLIGGAARMIGPVLLSAAVAGSALRRWAAPHAAPR